MYLPEEFQFNSMLALKKFIVQTRIPTDHVINIQRLNADLYVLFAWVKQ